MGKFLLGIDVGTSACKVALFDNNGRVVAQIAGEYPIYYPAPGYVEQNPKEWWDVICKMIGKTIKEGRVTPSEISGIGIAGQSWSSILVDKNGNVLANTPIWMDTRASDLCSAIVERVGFDRIFNVSGNSFEATYTTPKILWFKENHPDTFRKTFKVLQSNSFIAFKLTGRMTQDVSQGYGLHVFNMNNGKWDSKFCDEIGIPEEILPDIFQCHDVIGEVTHYAARETGLIPGIPVVAGGLDAACGTLGAGVIKVGQTQEQGGQAGGMSICTDKTVAHPKLILGFHVVPKRWLLQGGTVGGGAVKWFQKELGTLETSKGKEYGVSVFKLLDEEASKINPGSDGVIFLPYMAGERSPIWNKDAKGVFFGLGYDKTRAHMFRAVLEGCAFALQHNLKIAEEAGANAEILNSMGGAANSLLWTQIKADVTGKEIHIPAAETATTLGAAILAGVGTGVFKNFEEAIQKSIKIDRIHKPEMKNHEIYKQYYGIYREIYENLKDTMYRSSRLQNSFTP